MSRPSSRLRRMRVAWVMDAVLMALGIALFLYGRFTTVGDSQEWVAGEVLGLTILVISLVVFVAIIFYTRCPTCGKRVHPWAGTYCPRCGGGL